MTVPNQVEQTQDKQPTDLEKNIVNIRKSLEKEREEKVALKQEVEELKRLMKQPKQVDDDDDYSNEPYVDPRTLDKKLSKFEKSLESRFDQKVEQRATALIEQERQVNYLKENTDFQEVMSPEVLQRFVEKHPKVANAILGMPDNFERQKLVYENIKAFGVHKKDEPKPIQDTINNNRRSAYYQPSGIASAPYAAAGDFSATGQKSAYQKMQDLKNRLRLG